MQVPLGGRGRSQKATEFRFQLRDDSEHLFRVGGMPELIDASRELIERHLGDRFESLASDADRQSPGRTEHSVLDFAVLFFLLGAFMLFTVEYFFLAEEYYAGGAPWSLIVLTTLIVSLLSVGLLKKHADSREDVAKLALVVTVSTGLVIYAVLPRINQWTSGTGPLAVDYTLDSNRVWRADDPALPTFAFGGRGEFWDSFQPGDRKQFALRRGGLGFWQINMQRLYQEQKEFYDSR